MYFAGRAPDVEVKMKTTSQLGILMRVCHEVQQRFNDWLATFDLNEIRYSVLTSLATTSNRGCSQSELADRLGQSESNISTLINRMQRTGLVLRMKHETDKRKCILKIGPAGVATLAQVNAERATWERNLFSGIPPVERTKLFSLLQKLADGFEPTSKCTQQSIFRIRDSSDAGGELGGASSPDPIDDPRSPQFALKQMLLALSAHTGAETIEREAA